jgi:hypothetical protein
MPHLEPERADCEPASLALRAYAFAYVRLGERIVHTVRCAGYPRS